MNNQNQVFNSETSEITLEESEDCLSLLIEQYRRLSLIEDPDVQHSELLLTIFELAQYDDQLAEAIEKTDLEIAEELDKCDKLRFYEELEQGLSQSVINAELE